MSLWLGWACCSPLARCPNAIRPLFHRTAIFTAVISTRSPHWPPANAAPTSSPPTTPPPSYLPPLLQQVPPPPFRFDEYPFTARRKGHAKLVVSIVNHPNSHWFQWNKWVGAAEKESKGPCGSSKLGDALRGSPGPNAQRFSWSISCIRCSLCILSYSLKKLLASKKNKRSLWMWKYTNGAIFTRCKKIYQTLIQVMNLLHFWVGAESLCLLEALCVCEFYFLILSVCHVLVCAL